MPAVQNPHWSAWCSWNASWSAAGLRGPRSCVTSRRRPGWRAVRQARTGSPSSWTVHAPHAPSSQPTLVPVSPSWSRMKSARSVRGSTSAVWRSPLTRTRRADAPGGGGPCRRAACRAAVEVGRRIAEAAHRGPLDERAAGDSVDERALVVAPRRRRAASAAASRGARAVAHRRLGARARGRRRAARPRACPAVSTTAAAASAKYAPGAGVSDERGPGARRQRRELDAGQQLPRREAGGSVTVRSVVHEAGVERGEGDAGAPRAGRRGRPSRRPCPASASPGARRGAPPGAAAASARRSATRALERRLADGRADPSTPSVRRIRPGMPLMSTSRAGRTSRRFSSGTRLWPPASTCASSLSASTAASHESAATYSNGAGFTAPT